MPANRKRNKVNINELVRKLFTKNKKIFLYILAGFLVILLVWGLVSLYFSDWRKVYVNVKGSKVYFSNYKFVLLRNAQENGLISVVMNPFDTSTSYFRDMLYELADIDVIARRILYLEGQEHGFTYSDEEINKKLETFKNSISNVDEDPDKAYERILGILEISEKDLMEFMKEEVIVDKEIEEQTKNLTISENEISTFYKKYSSSYIKNGETSESAFKNHYDQIRSDALEEKKKEYILSLKKRIVEDASMQNEYSFDTPYKRFMRWFYGTFLGHTVPEEYSAEKLP